MAPQQQRCTCRVPGGWSRGGERRARRVGSARRLSARRDASKEGRDEGRAAPARGESPRQPRERMAGATLMERAREWVYQGFGVRKLPLAAAVIAFAASVPLHANAITEENLLYLEAWRAVYQAYYDGTYNGQNWFKLKERTLKENGMQSRKETYAAIESNLSTLGDPYTKLLDPSKYAFITANKKGGKVSGVGLELAYPKEGSGDEGILVVNTQPGSPAEKSGVASNDILLQIDDRPTAGMSLYEAAALLKGEQGTHVSVKVRRGGDGPPSSSSPGADTLDLERTALRRQAVSSNFCDLGATAADAGTSESGAGQRAAGYIRLSSFSDLTDVEVRAAVSRLKSEGVSNYVLDMRNNGGGSFESGVNVARIFINEGVIVNIADSKGNQKEKSAHSRQVPPTPPQPPPSFDV